LSVPIWAVAVAGLVAGNASAAPPARSPLDGLLVGGLAGYETADVAGLSLRVDAELPSRDLGSRLKLSWVGSICYSRLTESLPPFSDFKSDMVKAVPSMRFTLPLSPSFDVFGDVGAGLAFVAARLESHVPFFGDTSVSSNSLNFMMRFGAGAWLHLSPALKVGALLELDPIFGDYGMSGAASQTTFNVLAGAMYRL
jgi:hypothetical protein